jgi:hypothetical protein
MASDDMNHMQHLESVALSDCAVLQTKEATYQGSWKRAGGRSAWFMARRNMDRLLTMMKAKPVPSFVNVDNVLSTLQALDNSVHYGFDLRDRALSESKGLGLPGSIEASRVIIAHLKDAYTADDIFGRIAQKPKGEDGTVLACVRDLRRYLMLVEAEMIAEGVVETETLSLAFPDGRHVEVYKPGLTDVYALIADEQGVDRQVVKDLVHDLFYTSVGQIAQDILRGVKTAVAAENIPAASPVVLDPGPAIGGQFEATADTPSCGDGSFDVRMQRAAEKRAGPPTPRPHPGNGSHHASLVPWEIGAEYRATLIARAGQAMVDACYSQRAPGVWRLEAIVPGDRILRELKDCYIYKNVGHVLDRSVIPAELQDQWPKLQQEMNAFEFGQSPDEFKFMYCPQGEKIVLLPEFQIWAKEP